MTGFELRWKASPYYYSQQFANFLGCHESVFSCDFNVPGIGTKTSVYPFIRFSFPDFVSLLLSPTAKAREIHTQARADRVLINSHDIFKSCNC